MMGNNVGYDADVIVAGAGPAGLLSALLLARRGHTVIVVERHPASYPLPRAVTYDDEVARILSSVGLDSDNNPNVEYFDTNWEMRGADNEVLARFDWHGETDAGWRRMYWFYQPELEQYLEKLVAEQRNIRICRNHELVRIDQDAHSVSATCQTLPSGSETVYRGRFMIGADGANSLVREQCGLQAEDLGFHFDWLIVDVRLKPHAQFDQSIYQFCDPARPTTVVPGGPGRRRWEFMLLEGETAEQMNTASVAWELLRRWSLCEDNAELERHAVWRFQARWSREWRRRRVLLAGDAAHLMPPFAGQGMCAALRDAGNLAWKLDLVLAGKAHEDLLDTYGSERREHVRTLIELSVELGKVICVTDPDAAGARNAQMMAQLAEQGSHAKEEVQLRLGPGAWLPEGGAAAGALSLQGRVKHAGKEGRFDEVVGRGWIALGWGVNPADYLTDDAKAAVTDLDIICVNIGDTDEAEVHDTHGRYRAWFEQLGAEIAFVRPDFYLAFTADRATFSERMTAFARQLQLASAASELAKTPAGQTG